MRDLFRWQSVSLALALLFQLSTQEASAQATGNYNFFDFQQKPYYFGITLGYNSSRFTPFNSDQFLQSDSIRVVESASGPGFNLGIVTNLKMGDHFDFRFLPTLSFAERTISYTRFGRRSNFSERRVESVLVEMPFHLRYKSAPYKDMRLFVIAGVKYAFDVASDSQTRQAETLVRIAPNEFALEYGAGVQFFFPFFIFSPEIKISHGIGNTLIYNENIEESTVLEKILSRTFTLSFHFEG
ncbi:outer membrane beta-barrel protein [Phaeodactylibacter xiamenensis]|uniref:type IX secretion/gliding motility protein PorT/SprT n=1 Tax=Phaeodactylibacter xiamenensis TaxID=1524460 RepID=UPI003BA902BF